jgi:hypothetical protein
MSKVVRRQGFSTPHAISEVLIVVIHVSCKIHYQSSLAPSVLAHSFFSFEIEDVIITSVHVIHSFSHYALPLRETKLLAYD